MNRRQFLQRSLLAGSAALVAPQPALAQDRGARPTRDPRVRILNPRERVPVGLIIDDSTCLVNLNRFAMPQFDEAWAGRQAVYHRNWKEWPAEIPDAFVRKFAEWALDRGVKGKYSVVPYPACVGRVDRFLPGWTRRELDDSLRLVRNLITPNWDIHPELISHTRVIDIRTGHPYPECSPEFMENWEWSTGRSADELTAYFVYALRILQGAGLRCDGITTPGGFGSRARPQLARATLDSVRHVFDSTVPHYFRDLHDDGTESVAPRVELASGLDGPDPRCVVSVVGCTGDWTGGWDCTEPEGVNRFITADLQRGRMVDVIGRGEPAMMVCHWTGIYWNGRELGLAILQEVERRLRSRFGEGIIWMKLDELSRYWAARELTSARFQDRTLELQAPFGCREFTLQVALPGAAAPRLATPGGPRPLREVQRTRDLAGDTWLRDGERLTLCFDLPRGETRVEV